MAISKIIYKSSAEDTGTVWMDVTQKTVTAGSMLSGTTALKNDGTDITGNIATKTSSNLTASGATVTAPAGYYASDASKAVASGSATTPATTITANPSISVNSSTGVITATASATQSVTPTVSAGYVSSGTAGTITVSGSNTSNLTTQAAQTIHPSTTAQSIASGKFLTGTQSIAAVVLENLTAGNIKKDVVVKIGDADDDDCVASVTGTYEGGGGSTTWETVYNGTVNCYDDIGGGLFCAYIDPWSGGTIDLNSVWRVTLDGVQYECTATWYNSAGDPYAIGNYTYDGGSGGTEYPFMFQTYWSNATGVVISSSGNHTFKLEKQVSGGGSSYTLIASDEVTVNTSSTTATDVTTLTLSSYSFVAGEMLYVMIRDKAGQRNGYFYGYDAWYAVREGTSSSNAGRILYVLSDAGGNEMSVGSSYGVYPYTFSPTNKTLVIRSRYNSTTTRTINGTYSIKIYTLTWPDGSNPYGA